MYESHDQGDKMSTKNSFNSYMKKQQKYVPNVYVPYCKFHSIATN